MFDRSGAPIDRPLLQAFTQFLSFRGPDVQNTWSYGPVGFGHTLLRTTRESLHERQPASLNDQLWITSDARIDCRAELEEKIGNAGRKFGRPITDSDLLLQAYAVWGEECVLHLRGDFAFAIWDAHRETLFCARDHFGVKPFYYAEIADLFVFSNTLNCLHLHPSISQELNDAAIGDFLLFGLNCDVATTTFRDIRRLPAAHCLTISKEGVRIRRYWAPPIDGCTRYRHSDEYVEHFQTLIRAAVADRLTDDTMGILLSGGLDSGTVAATAQDISANSPTPSLLHAYTVTNEPLPSDREGTHARQVADFLHIPIRYLAMDRLQPFEGWNDPSQGWPEPVDDPFFIGLFDEFRMIATDCRVVLSGEGSDNLTYFQMWPYTQQMMRNHDFSGLLREVPRYLSMRRSPWPGIRRRFKGLFGRDSKVPAFPQWLSADFVRRLDLERRWKEWIDLPALRPHPILPKAHASLSIPQWAHMLELGDPGVTHSAVEVRFPFLDLRVVNYLLSLPPFPWFFEKRLLREAMVGRLPESVRMRPKTPLERRNTIQTKIQSLESKELKQISLDQRIDRYINRSALPPIESALHTGSTLRPLCLNFWLQSAHQVRYNFCSEVRDA